MVVDKTIFILILSCLYLGLLLLTGYIGAVSGEVAKKRLDDVWESGHSTGFAEGVDYGLAAERERQKSAASLNQGKE